MTHLLKAQQLLDMTNAAIELAQAAEWDKVEASEDSREQLARELFAEPVPEAQAVAVRECVEKVLVGNAELVRLGAAEKQAIVKAMRNLRQGHQAHRAYNET